MSSGLSTRKQGVIGRLGHLNGLGEIAVLSVERRTKTNVSITNL
jgi:hypothetical protein